MKPVGMNLMSRRGAVDPVSLLIIAGVCILAVPNWRPWNWGKPKPPTKELVAAQEAAKAASDRAKVAEEQLAAIRKADEDKKTGQLDYSHQMITGAIESNKNAPDSTEKAITDSFLQRADIGMNAVLGKLTPELRAEVVNIVAQLRSGDVEKIKSAQAMLAEKDRELNQAIEDRKVLLVEKTRAEQNLATAQADRLKKTEAVTKLTAEVATYANKSYEKEKEAGSMGATVEKLFLVLGVLVLGYIFIHVLLPLWSQSYPNVGWLSKLAALGKNLTTGHL